MDLYISMEFVDNVIISIGLPRTNTAKEFKTIYTDVKKKWESLRITVLVPWLARKQTNRFSNSTEFL